LKYAVVLKSPEAVWLLDTHIWRSPIPLDMKIRLFRAYILPVLLYGSETWAATKELYRCIDAFDC